MYKCNECDSIFEEPYEISAESYYGVSGMFDFNYGNKVSVCPYCEGNYNKVVECEKCGNYVSPWLLIKSELGKMCDACYEEYEMEETNGKTKR